MKQVILQKKSRTGRIIDRGGKRESHEYQTAVFLAGLGFDIELLEVSNIPKAKNPDIEMLGTAWEMKAPMSIAKSTNETMFRKAVKQSGGRAIFDLRHIKQNDNIVEKNLLVFFKRTREMHRMIIIRKDGTAIDFTK